MLRQHCSQEKTLVWITVPPLYTVMTVDGAAAQAASVYILSMSHSNIRSIRSCDNSSMRHSSSTCMCCTTSLPHPFNVTICYNQGPGNPPGSAGQCSLEILSINQTGVQFSSTFLKDFAAESSKGLHEHMQQKPSNVSYSWAHLVLQQLVSSAS